MNNKEIKKEILDAKEINLLAAQEVLYQPF